MLGYISFLLEGVKRAPFFFREAANGALPRSKEAPIGSLPLVGRVSLVAKRRVDDRRNKGAEARATTRRRVLDVIYGKGGGEPRQDASGRSRTRSVSRARPFAEMACSANDHRR